MTDRLCPYFRDGIRGKCIGCQYIHTTCYNNFLCDDMNCSYGHGINPFKRKCLTSIYNLYENVEYDEKNACMYKDRPSTLNCYVKGCKKSHQIGGEDDFQIRFYVNRIIQADTKKDMDDIYEDFMDFHKKLSKTNKSKLTNTLNTPNTPTSCQFGRGSRIGFVRDFNKTPDNYTEPSDDELSQASTPGYTNNTDGSSYCEKAKCIPCSPSISSSTSPKITTDAPPKITASALEDKEEFPSLVDDGYKVVKSKNATKTKKVKDPIEEIEEVESITIQPTPLTQSKTSAFTSTSTSSQTDGDTMMLTKSAYDEIMKELCELREFKQNFANLMKCVC